MWGISQAIGRVVATVSRSAQNTGKAREAITGARKGRPGARQAGGQRGPPQGTSGAARMDQRGDARGAAKGDTQCAETGICEGVVRGLAVSDESRKRPGRSTWWAMSKLGCGHVSREGRSLINRLKETQRETQLQSDKKTAWLGGTKRGA